jgi:hypothetical protein
MSRAVGPLGSWIAARGFVLSAMGSPFLLPAFAACLSRLCADALWETVSASMPR